MITRSCRLPRRRLSYASAFVTLILLGGDQAWAQPAIEGYTNYQAMSEQIGALGQSDLAKVTSLGKTLGGREVFLLTVGAGKPDEKPAILVLGNVEAPYLAGSELAMRIARQIVGKAASDETTKKLLERLTFYFIPRPNPDASEAFFRKPYLERTGNERSTDDDRDGQSDEDPNEDLNGDGQITMLRVEDETGTWMPHPADPRVLIEADPKKNERGRYRIYTEGRDNDGDEQFNEDGPGGVSFNRNFTYQYGFFKPGAGPHQVSEVETRAVSDFAFSHPNIALVFTFTPEDNLMEPWKPNSSNEGERIKTAVLSSDADSLNYLAEQYRSVTSSKDAPPSPKGEGSFSEWAYFHYGRWSLAARGWWIPKTETKPTSTQDVKKEADNKDSKVKEAETPGEKKTAAEKPQQEPDKKKPSDNRGGDDIGALNWFKSQGIDGFVDWKPIEHPDFPGKKVEVGGFKPFLRINPPAGQLDGLAEKHLQFLGKVAELLPSLKLSEIKVEPLGGDVFRVGATVVNLGFLPTMSRMGEIAARPYPLQIKLDLPEGMKLATASPRTKLGTLAGNGGKAEHTWLVLGQQAKKRQGQIRVWSPSVGEDSKTVEFK